MDIRAYLFMFPAYNPATNVNQPPVGHANELVAWYHDGYIRVSGKAYEGAPLSDRIAHITNFHVQRDAPTYDAKSDTIDGIPVRASFGDFIIYLATDNSPSVRRLRAAINARDGDVQAIGAHIRTSIKDTLRVAVESIAARFRQLPNQIGQLALLGADILLDEDGHAWLLEFTKGPAFRDHPLYMAQLHNSLVGETVDLMFEVHHARAEGRNWYKNGTVDLKSLRNFDQIWPVTS